MLGPPGNVPQVLTVLGGSTCLLCDLKMRAHTGLSCGPASKFKTDMLRKLPGAPLAIERLREKLCNDSGTFHISELRAKFKEFDSSGDMVLGRSEIEASLRALGIAVPPRTDMDVIMSYFDKSGDGVVDCNEFIAAIRGTLNPRRLRVVTQAFNTLDKKGLGVVTQADLEELYEVHVKGDAVALGTVGIEQGGARHDKHDDHYSSFLAQWDVYESDGKLTLEDFVEYYHDLSTIIKDDLYFEWMIRQAWGASPLTVIFLSLVTRHLFSPPCFVRHHFLSSNVEFHLIYRVISCTGLSETWSGNASHNSRENLHHFEHHAGAVF